MNPGTEIRKPLRARKTMALSSRKQVDLLNKLKAVRGAGRAAGEENPACPPAAEGNGCCPASQREPGGKTGATQKPLLAEEPVSSLVVNSEISIYNDRPETLKDLSSPDVQQFLNAGALQDILCRLYEKEPDSPSVKPVEGRLEAELAGQLADPRPAAPPTSQNTAVGAAAEPPGETPTCPTIPVLQQEESRPEAFRKDEAPAGDLQRKRPASNGDEDVRSKCIKPSGEAAKGAGPSLDGVRSGLGKVACFIQNQLEVSVGKLDHGLQHLNERIARTHCLQKHEGIAVKIVKKISRLDQRINAVICFQKAGLSRKASRPTAHSQSKVLNCTPLLPSPSDGRPAPSKEPASAETVSSSVERSSDADELLCVDAMKKGSGVLAGRAAAHPAKAAAGSPASPSEKDVLLIDLTEEGSNPNKDGRKKAAAKRPLAQESLPASLPLPARQSPSQVPPRFPHLPPLPSVESGPERWKDLGDTRPPQKLELAVALVNQPKGIALQWNVSLVDPRCAPIESFSLFICLEDASSGATSDWRKTSVIKALPLPMACSLSQFPSSAKCYFTMQSRDIHGRYGPFCEIQAISAL